MDNETATTSLIYADRPAQPSAVSNALVFGWRAVLKFKHVPEQLSNHVSARQQLGFPIGRLRVSLLRGHRLSPVCFCLAT